MPGGLARAQAIFCSAHKEPDMINVNIRDRQCAMPECAKYPSCNFPGSTDGLYCGAQPLAGQATCARANCFTMRTQQS